MTMQGAYNAKSFVNEYLKNDLPSRLRTYRNEWNLDDENLPDPVKYLVYEPVAIDSWPTLITVAISMNGLERENYSAIFDPQYQVNYTMRTYVWVKDDDSDQCTAKRDRLSTVVRAALLDSPCLDKKSGDNNLFVMIDEASIREEYSELTFLKGERVMAGAYISYTLQINEQITVANIADSADEIRTTVNPLLPLLKDL